MENNTRLWFGSQYKFPLKLMEVANDDILIKWTDDEKGIIVKEAKFEESVMNMYPGFVQVETFHNLRRLFRDYNFKFRILQRIPLQGRTVEFRHPFFIKGDLKKVLMVQKRPRASRPRLRRSPGPIATSTPKAFKRRSCLQTWRLFPKRSLDNTWVSKRFEDGDPSDQDSSVNDSDFGYPSRFTSNRLQIKDRRQSKYAACVLDSLEKTYELFSGVEIDSTQSHHNEPIYKKQKIESINVDVPFYHEGQCELLQHFAKNELTESQFWELFTRGANMPCSNMSWEMITKYIDKCVLPALSPLHFKGFFYELPLSEM